MKKMINIAALVLFLLLLLNAFHLPEAILGFLFVGTIPGTTLSLSPTFMLIFHVSMIALIIFEMLAQKFSTVKQFRLTTLELVTRYYRTTIRSIRRTS